MKLKLFSSHIFFLFFLFIIQFPIFAQNNQNNANLKKEETVIAEGMGTSLNNAKSDAFRNAISQVVGMYVSSDTVVENYVTTSDKIKSKVEGFIKGSKLIKENKKDGLVYLTYEVTVSTDPVRQDLKEVVGAEFQNVGHPKVCVVGFYGSQDRGEQELNVTAVTSLNRSLIKRGYHVVDQYEIEKLRKEDQEIVKASKNFSEDNFANIAKDIANKLKSDIYVTTFGSVDGNKASVSTKVYNSYTAQIFGDETGYGVVQELSLAGQKIAVEKAISDSMEKILPLMSQHWQNVITNGQEYVLVFDNIDAKKRIKIKDLFKKNDFDGINITSYKQINATPGHAEFSVYAIGDPADFFDELLVKMEELGINLKPIKDSKTGKTTTEYIQRGGRVIFILE